MISPKRVALPTGLSIGSVNVYVFTEPVPTLIDTGIKSQQNLNILQNELSTLGLALKDIARIFISHAHIDHFGLCGEILKYSPAQVLTLDLCRPFLVDYPRYWQNTLPRFQSFFSDHGLPSDLQTHLIGTLPFIQNSCDPIPETRIVPLQAGNFLQLGDAVWQVTHVPGHASTQAVLVQMASKRILAADMLLQKTPTPVLEWTPTGRVPSIHQFLDSLDKLETLNLAKVYPGHGPPFAQVNQLIQAQKARIQTRKLACLSFIRQGTHQLDTLLSQMYPQTPPAHLYPGFCMLLGYLDLLLNEGSIEARKVSGIKQYYALA